MIRVSHFRARCNLGKVMQARRAELFAKTRRNYAARRNRMCALITKKNTSFRFSQFYHDSEFFSTRYRVIITPVYVCARD